MSVFIHSCFTQKIFLYMMVINGIFMFDLCFSEIHIYINDICIKFPSRVTVAHSIPAHIFSIKNTKSP
jgi:hypothetical protein